MSDICPTLTDTDIELLGKFRKEISIVQSNEPLLLDFLSQCDTEQSAGGPASTIRSTFIHTITIGIILSMAMTLAGGSAMVFQTYLPQEIQAYIVFALTGVPFDKCKTASDYAVGVGVGYSSRIGRTIVDIVPQAQSLVRKALEWSARGMNSYTCSQRAQAFEEAIYTITDYITLTAGGVGAITGVSLYTSIYNFFDIRIPGGNTISASSASSAPRQRSSLPIQSDRDLGKYVSPEAMEIILGALNRRPTGGDQIKIHRINKRNSISGKRKFKNHKKSKKVRRKTRKNKRAY